MKQLTLSALGAISNKALKSWENLGFGTQPEPGTICAQAGWDAWKAWELDTGEIAVTVDGLPSDKPFADKGEFVRWLEQNSEEMIA